MTNRFREVFPGKRHVLLPVIHVDNTAQALRNVAIARDCGADGVFLINHDITWHRLRGVADTAREKFPDFWIGMNYLDLDPREALLSMWEVARDKGQKSGLWTDNAGVDETGTDNTYPEEIQRLLKYSNWQGLYFGGVAFKHQRTVADYAAAAKVAKDYMDVVCTSGPGTGRAADVTKIRTMKDALGDHPLAIASGITCQNVTEYLPHADCFLVSTGISETFEELNPGLTSQLVRKIREYSPA